MISALEKVEDGAEDPQRSSRMAVPVTGFLPRVFITELRCATSVVWRKTAIGNCVPPATPMRSMTSPGTTTTKHRTMNRANRHGNPSHTLRTKRRMRNFGQTKTCWTDSAVCGTASGGSAWRASWLLGRKGGVQHGSQVNNRNSRAGMYILGRISYNYIREIQLLARSATCLFLLNRLKHDCCSLLGNIYSGLLAEYGR